MNIYSDSTKELNKSNKIYLLHTFGLGDAAMVIDAINILIKYEKNLEIFCKEKSAIEYFNYMNHNAKNFSLLTFAWSLIKEKFFSRKTPIVIRTSGGTSSKNKAIEFFLNILNIEYFYDTIENRNNYPCIALPQRISNNIKIIESYLMKNGSIKKMNNIIEKKHNVENFSFMNFQSNDDETINFKKIKNVNEIIFHFGTTKKYHKVLNEEKIKYIISTYRKKYLNTKFSIICGPREVKTSHSYESLFDEIITNKKICEFLNQSHKYDLCVCNDTGIGHILSQNGIKVDLCINSNSDVFLHKIMCKNTNQILII